MRVIAKKGNGFGFLPLIMPLIKLIKKIIVQTMAALSSQAKPKGMSPQAKPKGMSS